MTRYFAITADDQVHDLGEHATYFDALFVLKGLKLRLDNTSVRTAEQLAVLRDRISVHLPVQVLVDQSGGGQGVASQTHTDVLIIDDDSGPSDERKFLLTGFFGEPRRYAWWFHHAGPDTYDLAGHFFKQVPDGEHFFDQHITGDLT
jgi:hypothetical protein